MLQEVNLDKCTVCRVMGINRTKLDLKGLFFVLQAFFGVDTFAKMSYGWDMSLMAKWLEHNTVYPKYITVPHHLKLS